MVENKFALALAVVAVVSVALVGTAIAEGDVSTASNPHCPDLQPICKEGQQIRCIDDAWVCVDLGGPCAGVVCKERDEKPHPYKDENGTMQCECRVLGGQCAGQLTPICQLDERLHCVRDASTGEFNLECVEYGGVCMGYACTEGIAHPYYDDKTGQMECGCFTTGPGQNCEDQPLPICPIGSGTVCKKDPVTKEFGWECVGGGH